MFNYEFMKEFQYKRGLRIFYFLLCGVNIAFLISILADNSPLYKLSFTAKFGTEPLREETVVISRYLKSYKYDSDGSHGVTGGDGYGLVTHGSTKLTDLDAEIDCDNAGHLSEPIVFPDNSVNCSTTLECAHCHSVTTAASCSIDSQCAWNDITYACNTVTTGFAECHMAMANQRCWPCSKATTAIDCKAVGSARGHECVWTGNTGNGTCADGDIADDYNYCDKQISYIEIYAYVTIGFSACLMVLVITQAFYDGKAVGEARGLPVMLMVLTQALHGAALALGLAFYVGLDDSSDSYMITNFGAMGADHTHSETASDGTYFLAFVYFSIVFLTLCHAIHIVNLFMQRDDNWLGFHQLYASFL